MKQVVPHVLKATALAVLTVFSLGACTTVAPKEYARADLLAQGRQDKDAARKDVEPLAAELTLDEALARALKYNLDRRSKMMEEALAFNQLDVTHLDMLPRLVAQAGYSARSNDRITISRDAEGDPVPTRFTSQDRSHTLYDLGLTWSLLDFGLGYANSLQQADRVLIATEKRRKAMHVLMQDVRTAFWRAVSAQKLRDQLRGVIAQAEDALVDARQAEAQRIRNPIDSLRYQRQVLENLRLLEAIDQELSAANIELASLINAPLGHSFKAVEPQGGPDLASLNVPLAFMEELAMTGNADLREQFYNARIAQEETRKTLLRMFPNLTFSLGGKYDTDSYLANKNWNEAGLQLSFNVFNLVTAPIQKRLAEAGVALADQRRVTMQMAVTAQVHLARQQFANAVGQFNRAEAIWQTDHRINEHMANRQQVQAQSKLELVSAQTSTILSLLRRYQALSQVYAAEARLQATLGLEPRIGSVGALKLVDLQQQVAQGEKLSGLYQAHEKARQEAEQARLAAQAAEAARLKALAEKKAAEEAQAAAERQAASEAARARAEAEQQAVQAAEAARTAQAAQTAQAVEAARAPAEAETAADASPAPPIPTTPTR